MSIDCSSLYQPLSADTINDPYPTYSRLQLETPVVWDEDLFAWVISRHRDCRQVLQNPTIFTRDRRKLGRPMPLEGMSIQSYDPPEQIELRQALLNALRRVDVDLVSHQACDQILPLIQAQTKSFNFMPSIAAPVALHFACTLVGVQNLTLSTYMSIFDRLTRSMDSALDSDRHDLGVEATHELNDIIHNARPSARPGSVIFELDAMPNVPNMPTAYVRNTLSATFNAAYSTAYSSMGSFLELVLNRPELAQQIATTDNIAVAVQELLRFTCPAQSTRRFATTETVIGDKTIHQNDPILILMAAANRDPEVFERPNELILHRTPNPHLSFGFGPHHCAGARPAAQFLGVYISKLASWVPSIMYAGSCSWMESFTLRCLDNLPLIRKDVREKYEENVK